MEWSRPLKEAYWNAANHASQLSVQTLLCPGESNSTQDADKSHKGVPPYSKEAKTLTSLRGISTAEQIRLHALGSMCREKDMASADRHWLAIYHQASSISGLLPVNSGKIQSSTYKISTSAPF